MSATAEQQVVGAANGFVTAAQGAGLFRDASVMDYLCKILTEITPADLTSAEAAVLIECLQPAYLRLHETAADSRIPRIDELSEILTRVSPTDLTATEALMFLTLLIPVHSRVITARSVSGTGQPLQRLRLTSFE